MGTVGEFLELYKDLREPESCFAHWTDTVFSKGAKFESVYELIPRIDWMSELISASGVSVPSHSECFSMLGPSVGPVIFVSTNNNTLQLNFMHASDINELLGKLGDNFFGLVAEEKINFRHVHNHEVCEELRLHFTGYFILDCLRARHSETLLRLSGEDEK